MKKDIELLEGDMIITLMRNPNTLQSETWVWDNKNCRAVELEEYLKRIQPIKRKLKLEKLKDRLG